MFRLLNDIRKSTHCSNASKKHEKSIESKLKKYGYKKTTIKTLGFVKQSIRDTKYNKTKKKMWYVSQPCGSQSFPDFIVGDKFGNVFYVECKSSQKDHITWNSGMPKPKAIYVFSCGMHNTQTIAMGSDLWTKEELELQQKIRKLIDETYKPHKNKDHGVHYYGRHMHDDRRPIYGDKNRTKRESRVYRFVEAIRKCQNS